VMGARSPKWEMTLQCCGRFRSRPGVLCRLRTMQPNGIVEKKSCNIMMSLTSATWAAVDALLHSRRVEYPPVVSSVNSVEHSKRQITNSSQKSP